MKSRVISFLVIAGGLLALGSDRSTHRQILVGDRVMTISTSETNALVAIDGRALVELRSDAANAVSIVVYSGRKGSLRESLVVSFKDNESEPYQVDRTIRDDKGVTAIVYGPDGSETARKFFPNP